MLRAPASYLKYGIVIIISTPLKERKKPYSKVTSKNVIMAKTTNMIVCNPKPLYVKPLPGEKRPSLEPNKT